MSSPLRLVSELVVAPLILVLAVVDFLPNPARFALRRFVQAQVKGAMKRRPPASRKIVMALDDSSHAAFEWALERILMPVQDHVHIVFIPEGDHAARYRRSVHFNRSNYMDVLEGVDFLWEYCQRLDMADVGFDCHVLVKEGRKEVSRMIVSQIAVVKPDIVVMGSSRITGP